MWSTHGKLPERIPKEIEKATEGFRKSFVLDDDARGFIAEDHESDAVAVDVKLDIELVFFWIKEFHLPALDVGSSIDFSGERTIRRNPSERDTSFNALIDELLLMFRLELKYIVPGCDSKIFALRTFGKFQCQQNILVYHFDSVRALEETDLGLFITTAYDIEEGEECGHIVQ